MNIGDRAKWCRWQKLCSSPLATTKLRRKHGVTASKVAWGSRGTEAQQLGRQIRNHIAMVESRRGWIHEAAWSRVAEWDTGYCSGSQKLQTPLKGAESTTRLLQWRTCSLWAPMSGRWLRGQQRLTGGYLSCGGQRWHFLPGRRTTNIHYSSVEPCLSQCADSTMPLLRCHQTG